MIEYQNGELKNLLPAVFAEDAEVIALSFALKRTMADVLQAAARTGIYADLDGVPEKVLDYLAKEWKVIYYRAEFSVQRKREILKNALKVKMFAGTKSAVQQLASMLFGKAEIEEWFEFREAKQEPGYFDVKVTAEETLTAEQHEGFGRLIEDIKNASSHIRTIKTQETAQGSVYTGAALGEALEQELEVNGG